MKPRLGTLIPDYMGAADCGRVARLARAEGEVFDRAAAFQAARFDRGYPGFHRKRRPALRNMIHLFKHLPSGRESRIQTHRFLEHRSRPNSVPCSQQRHGEVHAYKLQS